MWTLDSAIARLSLVLMQVKARSGVAEMQHSRGIDGSAVGFGTGVECSMQGLWGRGQV